MVRWNPAYLAYEAIVNEAKCEMKNYEKEIKTLKKENEILKCKNELLESIIKDFELEPIVDVRTGNVTFFD